MESFTNSCRLCLWKGDKMLPIFTSPDDDETASKIRKCLPLDVRWEDNLPKGICASCLYKVEMLYEFHCSSVRVDSLLRKYLASENKDFAVKEQQLSSSGYQVMGAQTMRSVATGTDDEYVPSTRIRECRESSGDRESMVSRVRVRTPSDVNEMNSVGTSPMVQLPLRQSDQCTSAVSFLAYRSDSAQAIDSASTRAAGVTEQSAANNRLLFLSGRNATTYQGEDSRQPEPETYTSSQGDPSVTGHPKPEGETDIVCLTVKSSVNAMQNELSTSRSCECGDDDEVVVLAEYQKPPQPFRRSKTPIPFDSSSTSLSPATVNTTSTSTSTAHGHKTQRLCARHQEFLRLMNLQQEKQRLQQQGLPRQETRQGTDQLPPRASEQTPAADTSSSGPTFRDAARQVRYDTTQQATKDQSSGGDTTHPFAKTPSNSTQSEEHVQPHTQSGSTCGATSSKARRASSELSRNTNRPGHLEHVCHVVSAKHGGVTTETVSAPLSSSAECISSVSEPQDQPRQATSVSPQGTAVESSQTKPCGSTSSSADSRPPSAASASVLPPAASLPVSVVPPASPATTPIPVPPSSAVLPKTSASISSILLPETSMITESAASPIVTSSVTQSTVTANFGRTATHPPSPGRSPSGGETSSSSTAQKRSTAKYRSRTSSKSPSGGRGRSSKSPVSTYTSRPTPPTTPSAPSATQAPPALVPLTTTITWPLSSAPTSSPSLLCISPQLQQQETRQQRVRLSANSSAQPERQLIQGRLQDGLLKFPAFLVVTNASFHPTTQPEQQGNMSPGLHAVSPSTATTNLSAQSLPSSTPQILRVPKEEEQKQQSEQTRSPGKAISQLIAASALISPPRDSAQPEQQVNQPGEVQRKTSSPLAAMHLPTTPLHSCAQPKQCDQKSEVQCKQEKNRQQIPCDKLLGKTVTQPKDTENKGCSSKTGQTLSGADQRLSATSQSSKRKRDQRSHSVIADLLAAPVKSAAASPTPEQPKKIKLKLCSTHSPSEKRLLKSPEPGASPVKSSTEITEKMKQTPQVAEKRQSGGTVEQHQTMKAPALQNSDVSQKWKKKKRKKKEKEEEESRHHSSHKSQQKPLSHKRKQPSKNSQEHGEPSSKCATAPSPQQNQKIETASQHCSSQSQSVTATYELSGGEAEQAQVERWRTVQQDAVERVQSAVRETAQLPQPQPVPPLPDDTTSAPLPSSTAKTPPPPVLTPQRPSEEPFSRSSASPPLLMLPPAVSAAPRTESPQSAGPRPQCATPPSGEKSPLTPFLTPPDGDDQQRSRLQQPAKAAAETSERRLRTPSPAGSTRGLRTPSPAASTGSGDWPSVPHRSGTSPRRYYNRKRRPTEASGAGRSGTENAAVGTECETLAPPPQPATTRPAQVPVVCPGQQQQSVPSTIAPQRSTAKAPLLPQRSARVFRYSCRYCRQRFRARILLSLHRVNGACELHRSHNYARSGDVGCSDHPRVTERELMLAAHVRLERLYACPRCSHVLSSENTLKWHLAVRHGHDNPRDTRSTLQSRWPTSTPTPTNVLPTLPLLLPPLTGKLTDSKDTVLEALGLTRKT